MSEVTIYHNPRCSKSRATLELLTERGIEPTIIEYLDTPPDADTLAQILAALGMTARQLMRKKEAAELDLADDASEAELIAAMTSNPIVIERPIVTAGGRAAIGRPPESVLDIL